jgi:hypothetical protein
VCVWEATLAELLVAVLALCVYSAFGCAWCTIAAMPQRRQRVSGVLRC